MVQIGRVSGNLESQLKGQRRNRSVAIWYRSFMSTAKAPGKEGGEAESAEISEERDDDDDERRW